MDTDITDVLGSIRVPTLVSRGARVGRRGRRAMLPSGSPARSSWSCSGAAKVRTPTPSPSGFATSRAGRRRRGCPTRCSRPSCSPTSSVERSAPQRSATPPGGRCSTTITARCAASLPATAGSRWTRPATGSSAASTVLRACDRLRARDRGQRAQARSRGADRGPHGGVPDRRREAGGNRRARRRQGDGCRRPGRGARLGHRQGSRRGRRTSCSTTAAKRSSKASRAGRASTRW